MSRFYCGVPEVSYQAKDMPSLLSRRSSCAERFLVSRGVVRLKKANEGVLSEAAPTHQCVERS